jgi:predicted MFS family arabinose efflux permease
MREVKIGSYSWPMKAYFEVLRMRSARLLLLSAFPARLAYSMIGLGIYFKVQQTTHSIAIAGLAVGAHGLSGAISAGIRGELLDRFGMKWPLRVFVPAYASMILVFNASHSRTPLLIFAFLLGITAPPINLSVRPLWKVLVGDAQLRTAYAMDTSMMNSVMVLGPVLVTFLALSKHPSSALIICALSMLIGGLALLSLATTRSFVPEIKVKGSLPLWKVPALQLLAIEGAFIGFGWGAFDIGVPAFSTLRHQPHIAGTILAIMGAATVVGGLLAGLLSKKISSLKAMRGIYALWFITTIPLAFTTPGWSMMVLGGIIGLIGGAIQVFYWEVTEAVRPQGSQSGALGWLWSIEGTCGAAGAALGGVVAEKFGPQWCLASTTIAIGFGFLVINTGRRKLSAADKTPSDVQDRDALGDVISTGDN